MDHSSPPSSSVHGIFQAGILEWVAISFSEGSFQPRDQTRLLHCQVGSLPLSHVGSPRVLLFVHKKVSSDFVSVKAFPASKRMLAYR